jgi:S1-C subfamily serine protease
MARRIVRLASLVLGASPLVLATLLVAPQAPAGPPGPWVFIPPPGSATTTTPTPTTTATGTGIATGTAKPAGSGTATPTKDDGMDRARKATVVLERSKKPVALGVFLSEKAYVLTARSPIVNGTGDIEVRFPESNVVTKAKVIHEDVEWDLALLALQSTKGVEGAKASDTDPLSTSVTFSTFVLLKTGKVQAQPTQVLGKRDFLSPDGDTLKDALSLDTKSLAIGTPLVDQNGGVVAMVGRACAPGSPKATVAGKGVCMPQLFGAPLAIVKKFLKGAPANAKPFTSYLGVAGTPDALGVKVTEVKAGSPAAAAGLKVNDDTIVAVDSAVVRTMEELHEKIDKHAPGDVVTLLVARAGTMREVKATLKSTEGPDTAGPPSIKLPPIGTTPLPGLPPMPTIVIKPQPKK